MTYFYTVKQIAEMLNYSKSPIQKVIRDKNIKPYNRDTRTYYYSPIDTKEILLTINPCFDTSELDKQIFEMNITNDEINRTPTEQEQAEREFIIKHEKNRAEIAQQQLLIDMLKEQLSTKDKQIGELNKQISEKDTQIIMYIEQNKLLLDTVTSNSKQILELTSTIEKQAAAISQAQQLTLIAQADKVKEMQRENEFDNKQTTPAAKTKDTTQQQASRTANDSTTPAANLSFINRIKKFFK